MAKMSGIYGLFRLDGGPVDSGDCAILGLDRPAPGTSACAAGEDDNLAGAVHRAQSDGALTVLVGALDEAEALAEQLGLSASTPSALLARAALGRFGEETPARMTGEWSLLHFDSERRLTLMLSAGVRDRIFYAINGETVAVAPDLVTLSNLAWVGRQIDESGMLFALGRAQLRSHNDGRTMLGRVQRLEAGKTVVFDRGDVRRSTATPLTAQPRWPGSFTDAMVEAEQLLRTIVGQRMQRNPVAAAMLSGGLDSSTLAWLAAEQRCPEQKLLLLTSVAPPGCNRPDERRFAEMVAAQLGLQTAFLYPAEEVNLYRPCDAILQGSNGPPMATRHGMTEPFQRFAADHGAGLLFNGTFGEMTVTVKQPVDTLRHRLRRVSTGVRRWLTRPVAPPGMIGPFNVQLAPHRISSLPDAVADALAAPSREDSDRPADGQWGYRPGAAKALRNGSEPYAGAVREDFPFRDIRLLRLFAGFPAAFMTHGAISRAPVRHMLRGHLPDAVRLRSAGLPASPDHLDRLQRQAGAARARITDFRKAEVDDWIDLDWLETALCRIAATGPVSYADANDVQLTAVTAEFLLWWRSR